MTLLAEEVYKNNKEKGFWDDTECNSTVTQKIAACAENVVAVATLIEHLRKGGILTAQTYDLSILDPSQVKVLSKLVLIVTEVAEAIDAYFNDPYNLNHLAEELADIHIRTFDIEGFIHSDCQHEVLSKNTFNKTRPHRHGKFA